MQGSDFLRDKTEQEKYSHRKRFENTIPFTIIIFLDLFFNTGFKYYVLII